MMFEASVPAEFRKGKATTFLVPAFFSCSCINFATFSAVKVEIGIPTRYSKSLSRQWETHQLTWMGVALHSGPRICLFLDAKTCKNCWAHLTAFLVASGASPSFSPKSPGGVESCRKLSAGPHRSHHHLPPVMRQRLCCGILQNRP